MLPLQQLHFCCWKRSQTIAFCPSPGFCTTKLHFPLCVCFPAGGLVVHSLYWNNWLCHSPRFLRRTGSRTPVRVPEAQRFCMEAAEFLDPDKNREPLRSLLFVFPVSARSRGRHQPILQLGGGITLLLGGLVAAPHLSIVCLQTLWGSGFGD